MTQLDQFLAEREFARHMAYPDRKELDIHLCAIVSNEADGTSTVIAESLLGTVLTGVRRIRGVPFPVASVGVMVRNGNDWFLIGTLSAEPQSGVIAPQFFADTLSGGTATSYTDFATHATLLVAPFDLTMVVTCHGHWGFQGSTGVHHLRINDESGADIRVNTSDDGTLDGSTDNGANSWHALSSIGKKDYAAGETCGYKLAYYVSASSLYIRSGTKVEFYPRS